MIATRRIGTVARLNALLLYLSLTLGAPHAIAQGVSQEVQVSLACMEMNQAVLAHSADGRLEDAERELSVVLADGGDRSQYLCGGLILHNMSVLLAGSGRLADAEKFAERSIKTLAGIVPPEDHALLRPLQVLAATRFEQGETAKAREAFARMRTIRVAGLEDQALVHGMAAALFHAEGRWREAESDYLFTIAAWEEAGRGATADAGVFLIGLGSLYIEERRPKDARRALARAAIVLASARDAVPMDRIKLLNVQAALCAQQGQWGEAEQDLQDAVSIADGEAGMNPVNLGRMLGNYAYVLRKNHHRREARSVEARAAVLPVNRTTGAVVDVADLVASTRRARR